MTLSGSFPEIRVVRKKNVLYLCNLSLINAHVPYLDCDEGLVFRFRQNPTSIGFKSKIQNGFEILNPKSKNPSMMVMDLNPKSASVVPLDSSIDTINI